MECPLCSSTDIQSHAVVRAEGTDNISISHRVWIGIGGSFQWHTQLIMGRVDRPALAIKGMGLYSP